MTIDLKHPLVQAKLLTVEKEEKVKALPTTVYGDLEGAMKDLAGPSGCHHVIINLGLVNDVWEAIEAIVCDGEIKASNVDLRGYKPPAEVERAVAEVYSIPAELLKELEEYSKIEVGELVEYEVVRRLQAPPLPRIAQAPAPEKEIEKPTRPTDLLTALSGEWAMLKQVTHSIIIFLEASGVEDYAVGSGKLTDGRTVAIVYLPPEYKEKYEEIKSGILEAARDQGVRVLILKIGGSEEVVEVGG